MGYFDRAIGNNDPNFFDHDVSEGVTKSGMIDYAMKLHAELLKGVSERLDDTKGIENAIIKGWQGASRDKFLEKFSYAIDEVKEDLDREYSVLLKKLAQLADSYYEEDKKMIDEELM